MFCIQIYVNTFVFLTPKSFQLEINCSDDKFILSYV